MIIRGTDTFDLALSGLRQDTLFGGDKLSAEVIIQLLWAGCGVTPHIALSKRGLTGPLAVADYYLTQRIYVVTDSAVFRCYNRTSPGTNYATCDHRVQVLVTGDRRDSLRGRIHPIARRVHKGLPAPARTYVCQITAGAQTIQSRVTLVR